MTKTVDHHCQTFREFAERSGMAVAEGLLERICDAHWNHGGDGVTFRDIHQHNACNHTLSGSIEHEGETLHFIIDDGDWGGTVVREFGTVDDVGVYEPPKPQRYMFVPADDNLATKRPEMWKMYLWWTKQPWFTEQLGKYHYDRHFQPGCAIEDHYRKWAAERGLKIVPDLSK